MIIDYNFNALLNTVNSVRNKSELPLSGVSLIKKYEGLDLVAVVDPLSGNLPITIGYGATVKADGTPFHLGDRITKKAATELLMLQLKRDYLPKLKTIPNWDSLTERQQGALLSFSYNLGANFYHDSRFKSMRKMLQNRNYGNAAKVFSLYRNPGSNCELGLLNRRRTEAYVFTYDLNNPNGTNSNLQ